MTRSSGTFDSVRGFLDKAGRATAVGFGLEVVTSFVERPGSPRRRGAERFRKGLKGGRHPPHRPNQWRRGWPARATTSTRS